LTDGCEKATVGDFDAGFIRPSCDRCFGGSSQDSTDVTFLWCSSPLVYPLPYGRGSAGVRVRPLSRDRQGADGVRSPEKNSLPHPLFGIVYLITFSCYGSHLPGQEGTTDREHNVPGTRLLESQPRLRQYSEASMKQAPFEMDSGQRNVALDAVLEVSRYKQWRLLAAQVRSNHVHVVVDADGSPELVMNAFKAYASRALNLAYPREKGRIRWTRHGSTRHLWSGERIEAAITYVLEKQGEPMACYRLPAS
jgi:REP element-mobilizing transposase RayT